MKRNIDLPGTSMYHVARQLNIGRTTLLKGLRILGILDSDNSLKDEYKESGLLTHKSFAGPYRNALTLRANEEGINFIRNLCLKNPELFRTSKKLSYYD